MKIPQHIYMVGIGGIGMSALAQLLLHEGKEVSGTDREDSPVVEMLSKKGIEVTIDVGGLPEGAEMLIYSDAVPTSNLDRQAARDAGIPELSYFEALGEISKGKRTIAVAGTHGKTTTTGMLAKILADAEQKPTAIVGSIVRDFGSNFLAGDENLFIVEACEYRDHLLKLDPEILVITNIELDHTDYFPDLEALKATFRKAAEKVPAHGAIVTNPNDPIIADVLRTDTYRGQASVIRARVFDYTRMAVGSLQLIGEFNRENARAALAAAHLAFPKLSLEADVKSLSQFKGSWRRFEYKGETPAGAMVYDDYAHHPTAIEKTIDAARKQFPEKKIVVAFHPHLYSRTKSFLRGFAGALAKADQAIVAPIYAAREKPDPNISNVVLANEARELGGEVIAIDSFDEIREE
ncbi:MAG TPA: UDP-N-acetylmuramate--L-alanine ligase, partial [Candidatus Paceibacterota bacterium]|nr:UDP-N-acetylmuramate--L-alanine ligase [Candidatus Paceibacterota bacterium]